MRWGLFHCLCEHSDDMALLHWLAQNPDHWFSITKKSLNSHQIFSLNCDRLGLGTGVGVTH